MMFHELSDISWYYVSGSIVFFFQDMVYTIMSMMDVGCSRSFVVFLFSVPQELSACYAVSRFLAALPAMDWWIEDCLLRETAWPRCQHLQAAEKQKYESKVLLIRFNSTFQGQRHQKSIEKLGTSKNWGSEKILKSEPQLLRNTRTWQRQLAQIQHCAELAKPLADLSSWFRRKPRDTRFLRYFMVFSCIVAFGSAAMGRKKWVCFATLSY